MNMQQAFEKLALLDMSWVVWVLVFMSVLSLAVTLERIVFFWRWAKVSHVQALEKLQEVLRRRDYVGGAQAFSAMRGTTSAVLSAGLASLPAGAGAAEEAMLGVLAREKLQLERYLTFLGTVSNNAPFLGLFGTVTGLMKSFYQLGQTQNPDMKVVMFGVTEALVTTALGLIVAIPAVIANNAFRRRVRAVLAQAEELARLLLSHARRSDAAGRPAGAAGGEDAP